MLIRLTLNLAALAATLALMLSYFDCLTQAWNL